MAKNYNLKKLVQSEQIKPSKKLGQNFIFDSSLTDQIAKCANLNDSSYVYEVGPGPGGLTKSILGCKVKSLIAIEQDERCFKILTDLKNDYPQLELIKGDALNINEKEIIKTKTKIIANLPYNIGTALVCKWIFQKDLWQDFTIMLQKEVVDRIIANPGCKDYGRLSIICQILCDLEYQFTIGPEYFYPPPKVDSSVIRMVPKEITLPMDVLKKVEVVTRNLFSQRRKMIKATLKNIHPDITTLLYKTDIDLKSRPEEITVNQFIQLASNLDNLLK